MLLRFRDPFLCSPMEIVSHSLNIEHSEVLCQMAFGIQDILHLLICSHHILEKKKKTLVKEAELGDRRVPTTTIVAQTLVESWMIEIEIIAAA